MVSEPATVVNTGNINSIQLRKKFPHESSSRKGGLPNYGGRRRELDNEGDCYYIELK
jgi:hypothetical protein